MITNKYCQRIGILTLFIILLSSYVSAFGVGSAYHKEYPLKISPGETKEVIFNLQNPVGTDITARPSLTKGSEIMQLTDSKDIAVPVGSSIDVKAMVSIPSDTKIGDIYPVEITFTTVTRSESGAFALGSSVGRDFNVIIVPTPKEEKKLEEEKAKLTEQKPGVSGTTYIIGALILIAIILAILFITKKKKRK